jgi:hypothetical protein
MSRYLSVIAALMVMALPAAAHPGDNTPSFEVGGGYAFRSFDIPNNGGAIFNMNGWMATADYNFNDFVGATIDFDMTRIQQPNSAAFPGTNYLSTLMVGPQIYPLGHHKLTPFFHGEVGLAHYTLEFSSPCGTSDLGPCSFTDGSYAIGFGGGLDWKASRHISVRLAQADYEQTRILEPGTANGYGNQNHYKLKAGVLITFGSK